MLMKLLRKDDLPRVIKLIKKLLLNSFYGAFGRDKSKVIDTYIVTNPYTDFKMVRKSNFKGFTIINSITSIV